MLNTTFVAQRKSDGAVVKTWTPSEFWAPVAAGDSLFDPRVAFDALAGRWIAVIATDGIWAAPALLLAVSEASDPTGTWRFQKLPAGGSAYAEFPLVGCERTLDRGDVEPRLGIDRIPLGIGDLGNRKAPLLSGGEPSVTRLTLNVPGSPLAPVVTLDADQTDEFLVQQGKRERPGPRPPRACFRLD